MSEARPSLPTVGPPPRRAASAPLLVLGAIVAWTWTFWLLAAAATGALDDDVRTVVLFALGGLGPAVVAGVVVARSPAEERRWFVRRLVDVRRVPPWVWGAVVGLAVLPAGLAWLVDAVVWGTATGGVADGVTLVSVAGVVGFALLAGVVEEPGWRGVALDAFAGRASALRASLVIGAAHAAWHWPLFLIEGTYHHGLATGEGVVRYSVALLPLSVLLVWLCVRGGGSILVAVVGHALVNVAGELVPASARTDWLALAVMSAAAFVLAFRPRFWAAPSIRGDHPLHPAPDPDRSG